MTEFGVERSVAAGWEDSLWHAGRSSRCFLSCFLSFHLETALEKSISVFWRVTYLAAHGDSWRRLGLELW